MTKRRRFLQGSLAGAAAALAAFGINPALAQEIGKVAGRSDKPLKAAFSNAGLQATWCAQGKQAAEYWGKLFNVDVTWFDGELAAQKQRAAIDNMASQKWDFVAIQAFGIGTLTAPVNKMIEAGIPVIDMDTLIAPLDYDQRPQFPGARQRIHGRVRDTVAGRRDQRRGDDDHDPGRARATPARREGRAGSNRWSRSTQRSRCWIPSPRTGTSPRWRASGRPC